MAALGLRERQHTLPWRPRAVAPVDWRWKEHVDPSQCFHGESVGGCGPGEGDVDSPKSVVVAKFPDSYGGEIAKETSVRFGSKASPSLSRGNSTAALDLGAGLRGEDHDDPRKRSKGSPAKNALVIKEDEDEGQNAEIQARLLQRLEQLERDVAAAAVPCSCARSGSDLLSDDDLKPRLKLWNACMVDIEALIKDHVRKVWDERIAEYERRILLVGYKYLQELVPYRDRAAPLKRSFDVHLSMSSSVYRPLLRFPEEERIAMVYLIEERLLQLLAGRQDSTQDCGRTRVSRQMGCSLPMVSSPAGEERKEVEVSEDVESEDEEGKLVDLVEMRDRLRREIKFLEERQERQRALLSRQSSSESGMASPRIQDARTSSSMGTAFASVKPAGSRPVSPQVSLTARAAIAPIPFATGQADGATSACTSNANGDAVQFETTHEATEENKAETRPIVEESREQLRLLKAELASAPTLVARSASKLASGSKPSSASKPRPASKLASRSKASRPGSAQEQLESLRIRQAKLEEELAAAEADADAAELHASEVDFHENQPTVHRDEAPPLLKRSKSGGSLVEENSMDQDSSSSLASLDEDAPAEVLTGCRGEEALYALWLARKRNGALARRKGPGRFSVKLRNLAPCSCDGALAPPKLVSSLPTRRNGYSALPGLGGPQGTSALARLFAAAAAKNREGQRGSATAFRLQAAVSMARLQSLMESEAPRHTSTETSLSSGTSA